LALFEQRGLKPYSVRLSSYGAPSPEALEVLGGAAPSGWLWAEGSWLFEFAGRSWGERGILLDVIPGDDWEWRVVEYDGDPWRSDGPDDLVVVECGQGTTGLVAMRAARLAAAERLVGRTVLVRVEPGSTPVFRGTGVTADMVVERLAAGDTIDVIAEGTAVSRCDLVLWLRPAGREAARAAPWLGRLARKGDEGTGPAPVERKP
jgi:hypothetical protein